MKIRIPLLTQDIQTAEKFKIKAVEGFDPDKEDFFLDGPVTRRVAVLDFDPGSGQLTPSALFVPPARGRKRGHYRDERGKNLYGASAEEWYSPAFMSVNVFAIILHTIYLFEEKETLGRELTWAFDAPQLLVIPRAGKMSNAFYQRDSHSLQFFYNQARTASGRTIYTCLSRDIVAHETGHAIIDGIVPDLADNSSPQSLALHEGLADLTALLLAFSSNALRRHMMKEAGGSLRDATAFSSIAEEFGLDIGHQDGLRNLRNRKNLDPQDEENFVDNEPHELSMVISGAMYELMIRIHEELKTELATDPEYAGRSALEISHAALWKGAKRLKRMMYRALDYLPPGEVSFADYGRALIAVDEVAYPEAHQMRAWLKEEFVKRSIVPETSHLDTPTRYAYEPLEAYEVTTLYESDWAAYDFVNRNRALFYIPEGIPFAIRPRLRTLKKYDYDRKGVECIFKVAWDHIEANAIGSRFPSHRRVTVGTTLAIDMYTNEVLALLTSVPPLPEEREADPQEYERRLLEHRRNRLDRNEFLRGLAAQGLLKAGEAAIGPDGRPLQSVVQAQITEGLMRTRNTTNFLHILGGE